MKKQSYILVGLLAMGLFVSTAGATSLGSVRLRYSNCWPRRAGKTYLNNNYLGAFYTGTYRLQLDETTNHDPDSDGLPGEGEGELLYGQADANNIVKTYCADIHQESFGHYQVYQVYDAWDALSLDRAEDLAKLFEYKRNLVTDNNTAAAFQASVWEIVNETSGTYSLVRGATDAGNFNMRYHWGSGWLGTADAWLSDLGNYDVPDIELRVLVSPDAQDYALWVPSTVPTGGHVPEPLTLIGVFGGVAGIGTYLRRRRNA